MGITIGDAILWLRGNDSKLDADLKSAETKTKGVLGRISANFKESMNFAMGQIMSQGLNQLAAGIERTAKEVIDLGQEYAQQVEDMARLSGMTVEDASRIIQVADDMRVGYGEVSTALKLYAKTQSDAGNAAKMDIDTLARLSDQYLELAPGVDRANFLLENFGRSGLAMGKMMEQGGEKIKGMADAVDKSLIMTKEGIKQSEEYRLAMDELDDTMKGIKLTLWNELRPYVMRFLEWLKTDGVKYLRMLIDGFVALPGPVKGIIVALGGLFLLLMKLGPALMGIAGIINILGGAGAGGGLLAGLGTALGAVSIPVLALIVAIVGLIATLIILGPQAKATFMMIAEIIAASLKRAGYELNKFFRTVADWAAKLLNSIGAWFKKIGTGIVDGIWSGIQGAWESLKTKVATALDDLLKWIQDHIGAHSESVLFKVKVGRPMGEGIGLGLQESMREQVQQIFQLGVQGMTLAGAQASQSISVGQLVVDSRLSQRERDYWDERSERIAEKSTMRWLKRARG